MNGNEIAGERPAYVTIDEAARLLGVQRRTIYRLLTEGLLRRRVLIPTADVEHIRRVGIGPPCEAMS
jgi:excisionase family DNA binding protein